jgi:hypothetical protein
MNFYLRFWVKICPKFEDQQFFSEKFLAEIKFYKIDPSTDRPIGFASSLSTLDDALEIEQDNAFAMRLKSGKRMHFLCD